MNYIDEPRGILSFGNLAQISDTFVIEAFGSNKIGLLVEMSNGLRVGEKEHDVYLWALCNLTRESAIVDSLSAQPLFALSENILIQKENDGSLNSKQGRWAYRLINQLSSLYSPQNHCVFSCGTLRFLAQQVFESEEKTIVLNSYEAIIKVLGEDWPNDCGLIVDFLKVATLGSSKVKQFFPKSNYINERQSSLVLLILDKVNRFHAYVGWI